MSPTSRGLDRARVKGQLHTINAFHQIAPHAIVQLLHRPAGDLVGEQILHMVPGVAHHIDARPLGQCRKRTRISTSEGAQIDNRSTAVLFVEHQLVHERLLSGRLGEIKVVQLTVWMVSGVPQGRHRHWRLVEVRMRVRSLRHPGAGGLFDVQMLVTQCAANRAWLDWAQN